MANYKFYRISEANAEIDRLTTALAAAEKERDEAKSALTDNGKEIQAALDEANTKLTDANKRNGELAGQISAKDGEISTLKTQVEAADKAKAEAEKTAATAKDDAKKTAATETAKILAATGVTKPIAAAPADAKPMTWTEKAKAVKAAQIEQAKTK